MMTEDILLATVAALWATLISVLTASLLLKPVHRSFLFWFAKRLFVVVTFFSLGSLLYMIEDKTWADFLGFLADQVFLLKIFAVLILWIIGLLFLVDMWRHSRGGIHID